jgi:hypothetical protein
MITLCLLAFAIFSSLQAPAGARDDPAALTSLLARYDELPAGPAKEDVERLIDAVAAQRYATFSRLYWYRDLDLAQKAARASRKPILSLRLLGRLDEDLSCANSRLFRVVLYADEDVSRLLRERFVLHWSSERAAPRVSIDFGDGNHLETTLAGNSVHYVFDSDLRPIDALPGLYGPGAFRRELEAVLPLASESPSLSDEVRAQRVRAFHRERLEASRELWLGEGKPVVVGVSATPAIRSAEVVAVTKREMEMPIVDAVAAGLPEMLRPELPVYVRRADDARLGARSRALVRRLAPTDWARDPRPLAGAALDQLVANLEAFVAIDTERNELQLHAAIHGWFGSEQPLPGFAALDERIYRELFLTPSEDPWLGMSGLGVFNGLPNDGLTR